MTQRKKLIEVALPLEAINIASAREKSIRHGHPSTLHLWWARRPLAAARAVIFTSLVDDPDDPEAPAEFVDACRKLPRGKNATINDTPRQRLFDFIELLVQWESTTDEQVLETARHLTRLATGGNPPALLDPFAGGGTIPMEAQRLGLEAHASDLNPVAVMINKAQIEIPPKFADQPPINPRNRKGTAQGGWKGTAGLAADVSYYGEWVREQAWKRIGHLYPNHNDETVIAWLWARTVKCPNPACGTQMPLVRSFDLSTKKGRRTWVEPQVDQRNRRISFVVRKEDGLGIEGTVDRHGATCLACGTAVPFDYVRDEAKSGRMDSQMMAIATEGKTGRNYYAPTEDQEAIARVGKPPNSPDTNLPDQALSFRVQIYGMTRHSDLFTARQLTMLTALSDLVIEAREQIYADACAAGLSQDEQLLRHGGTGAKAYSEAVSVYLAFGISRSADRGSTICSWDSSPKMEALRNTFARQAIPMTWDYAEGNPFSESSGNWMNNIDWVSQAIERLSPVRSGFVSQVDAAQLTHSTAIPISTDPPYYDNIGYADLSDYFYVWLRPSLRSVFPEVFGTMLVPKTPELIASPYRFNGDGEAANKHFEEGLMQAFSNMRRIIPPDFPLTVYYAFKQQEVVADEGAASTGWETMLNGLVETGFAIVGTWPIRTELSNRMVASGTNALASSIVLVCRPRPENAPISSRREFIATLRNELPISLHEIQSGNIAPVDMAQASIGPGMAVYSRYNKVLEANGDRLSVRAALQIINQELDAYLASQEGDIDSDSRFAVAWFEQSGFTEGAFGIADVLARAKNTSVEGLQNAGVLEAKSGKVRLYQWSELDPGWDPSSDKRATTWEAVHHLIERLNTHGEDGAAMLLAKMPSELASQARQLAYRLYSICERKGWAEHARDYNALVVSWGESQERAVALRDQYQQGKLL